MLGNVRKTLRGTGEERKKEIIDLTALGLESPLFLA